MERTRLFGKADSKLLGDFRTEASHAGSMHALLQVSPEIDKVRLNMTLNIVTGG